MITLLETKRKRRGIVFTKHLKYLVYMVDTESNESKVDKAWKVHWATPTVFLFNS